MDLKAVFGKISQSFAISRDITVGDAVLTLEPLTADEEIKVLEACKDYEGGQYLAGFKRHTIAMAIQKVNGEKTAEIVEQVGEDGKPQPLTRYLFFLKTLESWTSSLQDTLYEAYADMIVELDAKIQEKAKFNRFVVARASETVAEEIDRTPSGFKRVEEPESEGDQNDVEKLNSLIKKQTEAAQASMAKTEQEAVQANGKK